MMRPHDTPPLIAEALLRWVPEQCQSVLDPAVGIGALIDPFIPRGAIDNIEITCVDIDPDAIEQVRARFADSPGLRLEAHVGDFLESGEADCGDKPVGRMFDCIVMNPPFDGRRWVCATTIDARWQGWSNRGTRLPTEAAFILKAMSLVREGGRILAVVPPSVVIGSASQPLRELLLRAGRFVCVHELPPFTFERVEARIYLLVWEKGLPAATLPLLNHDLVDPDELRVAESALDATVRLDHSFYAARRAYDGLVDHSELGWDRLGAVVDISRGTVSAPFPTNTAVHLSDFDGLGLWRSAPLAPMHERPCIANASDILVSRVGRSALRAIGRLDGSPSAISDCILRLRPVDPSHQLAILLGLRVLFAEGGLLPLVQRTSGGARFIRVGDVRQIQVPMGLPLAFPSEFDFYNEAVKRCDLKTASRIEGHMRTALGLSS